MNTKTKITLSTLVAVLLATTVRGHASTSTSSNPGGIRPESGQRLGTVPNGFIPNVGQLPDARAKFVLRDRGVSAYFTEQGFTLWNGQTTAITRDGIEARIPVAPRWSLVGASPVTPIGGETFPHTVSFFRGNNPAKWRANVPAYRNLRYPEILNGVELRVESRERGFEYSFHVQSHAKADLRFRYDGSTGIETSLLGDLIVRTATGHFTESRPVSFQVIDGKRREVESQFEIVSTNEYRIALGTYDPRYELVVDPVLDWSTFLGTTYLDELRDLKVDANGDICVVGITTSTDLPDSASSSTGPGVNYDAGVWYSDTFVAKLDSSGTALLWLGYLSGAGAASDAPGNNGLVVDSKGDLYVGGYTASPDFPSTDSVPHAGNFDAFLTKIQSDGSAILWSSLLGGGEVDWGWGLALDPQENVLLTGFTLSSDFPVSLFSPALNGARDAFVTKFNPSGTVQWSTYLGGSGSADRAAAVVANAAGEIFVFGDTDSSDFANAGDVTLGGSNDAFVAKLAAQGTPVWTTLLGGSGLENDDVNLYSPIAFSRGDIAMDSAGDILVAGETLSADFPATAGAFDTARSGTADGFVAKLSAVGAQLIWATYLGGSGGGQFQDRVWGIAVNPWDEVFLTGRTDSSSFPVTADAIQTTYQGGLQDGFLAKLSANGSQLLYSTYLGGSQARDTAIGVTYDSGQVIVVGWAVSASFPSTSGAYGTGCYSCSLNGWDDGFVMKFLDAFIAHDDFESGNYSGGSGWAGNWTTSGDISILTSSTPHSGSRHVRLRSSTGYLQRTINLPPASTSARLGFWSKVDSFEGSDRADVLARSTGATFTTVASFTPAHSDNKYRYYEIDLTAFLPAGQITIAFDAAMNANNDNWYLDDIRLTGTSEPVPPVANAGPDQTVTDADNSGAETAILDGSASFDPDGGSILSFEWKEGATILGTGASLNTSLSVGVHTITLTVTDDEGATASDSVQITVNPYVAAIEVFNDSFEVSEWNGLWTEDSQNDWFRSTQRATQGPRSAEVDGSASDASLTSVAINLQGRNNATITFDWLIESGLDSGEYLEFRVSTNGGSTWTQQAILRGNVEAENVWHSAQVQLTGITQLKLQFRGKMNQDDEDANVDNVRVVAH